MQHIFLLLQNPMFLEDVFANLLSLRIKSSFNSTKYSVFPASSETSPIVLVGKGHGLRSAEKWQFLLLFPHSERS